MNTFERKCTSIFEVIMSFYSNLFFILQLAIFMMKLTLEMECVKMALILYNVSLMGEIVV